MSVKTQTYSKTSRELTHSVNEWCMFLKCQARLYKYPIVYITVLYGLRRSEALGLKWDSIDFTNKLVTIKHTVVKSKEVIEKDSTKNDSSYRVYPLSEDIGNLLLQLKQKENENRKLYGKRYDESDYIFKWSNGEMIKPDSLSRWFSMVRVARLARDAPVGAAARTRSPKQSTGLFLSLRS